MGYKVSTGLELVEIQLNEHGDAVYVSPEDSALFGSYVRCFDLAIRQSRECADKIAEIERKYGRSDKPEDEAESGRDVEGEIAIALEASRVNVDFSVSTSKAIDDIFGEGTVRKYFREHYEKVPYFIPGIDCFMDFFDQISPVMEEIFGRLIKGREEARKERMAKYQPQDHKKPGGKDRK